MTTTPATSDLSEEEKGTVGLGAPPLLADPAETVLSGRGLIKTFGVVVGLDGVNVDLFPGEVLAVIGDNGKILIFPAAELPEMPRGKGVKLQTYREGGLRDASVFAAPDGLATVDASGRTRIWDDWRDWSGRRASAGKLAPKGFPANKRFRPKA